MEKCNYVKEVGLMMGELGRGARIMLEQEHVRFIDLCTAAGGANQGARFNKGVMEDNVIQNLKGAAGDQSMPVAP